MWIDGHLDLAYLALCGRDLTKPCAPGAGVVDLPALRAAAFDLVLGTIYTAPAGPDGIEGPDEYPADDVDAARACGRAQLEVYLDLEARGEISIVRTGADLDADGPRPRVVLLMEGADPIADPDDVAWWREQGLRIVGLTWTRGTRYAGGNGTTTGLTEAGRALVAALDDAGLAHDASHLSDASFDDLLACATGPVVASHSNCRALVAENQRHLRDDQVERLAARDAIVGLNLYGAFLAHGRRATLDDAVAHVERVASIMGHRRGVGLGSDMDGGFGPEYLAEGLDHPSKLDALAAALRARGWSEEEVEDFRRRNWRRWLEAALG